MISFRLGRLHIPPLAVVVTQKAAALARVSLRRSDANSSLAGLFPPELKIVAFGSSSTRGFGASAPEAAYPAQLEEILRALAPAGSKVEVLNCGVDAEIIDGMALRIGDDVLANPPNIVIWQLGTNDALNNVPLARFETKTRAGIAAIRNAGIVVMLMEPQWCPRLDANGVGDRYRDAIRRIGRETGVPIIRLADLMREWVSSGQLTMAEMLSPDDLHMGDAGYRLLAIRMAFEVLQAEATRWPPRWRGRLRNRPHRLRRHLLGADRIWPLLKTYVR